MDAVNMMLSDFRWTKGLDFLYLDKNEYYIPAIIRTIVVKSHVTGHSYVFNRFGNDSIFYPKDKTCPIKGLFIAETRYIDNIIKETKELVNGTGS